MVVPNLFRKSAEAAVASYDYTDIADGTGVRTFYATATKQGGTVDYALIQTEEYSRLIEVGIGENQNINFDLTAFNLPQTLKGTAYVVIGATESVGDNYVITVQVQKWDGTSETNCSSVVTETVNATSPMLLMKVPLTQTNFARGDTLRLNIISAGVGSGDHGYGIDPKGRDGTYVKASNSQTTQLKFLCPFKIDL